MSAALASAGLMSDSLASAALAASINFGAAGSGGPMIDLLISEAAVADDAGFGEVVAMVAGPVFAGPAMLAIAAVPDASDLPVSARLSGAVEDAVVVATGARTGAEAGDCVAAFCCGGCGVPAGKMEACAAAEACGPADTEGVAVVCLASAPVTESSPCSITVTRENSRSRSLFSVSIAEASRRVSFWLSLAIDWICCAWRARSAAASCSRRTLSDHWLDITATVTAPTAAAPQLPIRQSARRSNSFSSANSPESGLSVLSDFLSAFLSTLGAPANWPDCFVIRKATSRITGKH